MARKYRRPVDNNTFRWVEKLLIDNKKHMVTAKCNFALLVALVSNDGVYQAKNLFRTLLFLIPYFEHRKW